MLSSLAVFILLCRRAPIHDLALLGVRPKKNHYRHNLHYCVECSHQKYPKSSDIGVKFAEWAKCRIFLVAFCIFLLKIRGHGTYWLHNWFIFGLLPFATESLGDLGDAIFNHGRAA